MAEGNQLIRKHGARMAKRAAAAAVVLVRRLRAFVRRAGSYLLGKLMNCKPELSPSYGLEMV